jgi:hypothetical protein
MLGKNLKAMEGGIFNSEILSNHWPSIFHGVNSKGYEPYILQWTPLVEKMDEVRQVVNYHLD